MSTDEPETLKFDDDGLIPAIAQDVRTGEVRMLAYMNEEALERTRETGFAHYWSRSRRELWKKGETSGHTQRVRSIRADCDRDTLLLLVDQRGVACHTGERNCFYNEWDEENEDWERVDPLPVHNLGGLLGYLEELVEERDHERPDDSYTTTLLEGDGEKTGEDLVLEKMGEEMTELLLAAKNEDRKNLLDEASDLFYHLVVLFRLKEIGLDELARCLDERRS